MMKIFIIRKCVNMKRIIERVVSQTIKEYINENFSRPSILKENDGDDMGVYKELDDKVFDICYRHGFNVQTRVGDDLAYYAFFIADDRQPKVQEAKNYFLPPVQDQYIRLLFYIYHLSFRIEQ